MLYILLRTENQGVYFGDRELYVNIVRDYRHGEVRVGKVVVEDVPDHLVEH